MVQSRHYIYLVILVKILLGERDERLSSEVILHIEIQLKVHSVDDYILGYSL